MGDDVQSSVPLIIIPAYNAGELLSRLLKKLESVHPLEHAVVVNDGSTDDTESYALQTGVNVIRHQHNRGKGAALASGFHFALKHNYDAVITIDADLQHPPEYIPNLIERAADGFDMVIGSRRKRLREIPLVRRISNYLSSLVVTVLTRTFIEDSQSGFRYISRKVLEKVILKEKGYQMETEIIVKASRAGFKIGFTPIPVIYNKEPSSMRHFRDALRFIRLTLRLIFT
jgi:glycosyltransferase involved in cell wall biosynthesis